MTTDNSGELGLREVTVHELQTIGGGDNFGIQELLSRYFQYETANPPRQVALTHEPTHQRS